MGLGAQGKQLGKEMERDFNSLAGSATPGVKFNKVHISANIGEARTSPQWEYWEAAMQEEQDSLYEHEVMGYVGRPRGHKVIPSALDLFSKSG